MMTKNGSTKIVNFITAGIGDIVLARGHVRHMIKSTIYVKFLLSTAENRSDNLSVYILMMTKK